MLLRALSLLAAACFVPACVATSDPDKGAEDDLPDGKDDSFGSPSNHGELRFAGANQAAFTDAEGFHAWTFRMAGAGKVDLSTELGAPNLDTVIYLYKKGSTGRWGQALHRNDDASSTTAASRLKVDLVSGEYRLLVKAYKRTQRGAFAVRAACTGAGCPSAAPACGPAATLPADTGYGGSCGSKLAAIYEFGAVDVSAETETSVADRCNLGELERKAVDYYKAYWDEVSPLDEDAGLTVTTRVLGGTGSGGGSVIDVSDGGDESAMSFVFDSAGKLVVLYQDNQSPDVRFSCRTSGARIELPLVEDCVGALVHSIPHGDGTEEDVRLTASTGNLPLGLGGEVRGPMRRYAASRAVAATTQVSAVGARWTDPADPAARLTITAAGKPATSYLATSGLIVLEAPAGAAATLVCAAP